MKQMKKQVLACLVAAVTCFSTVTSSAPALWADETGGEEVIASSSEVQQAPEQQVEAVEEPSAEVVENADAGAVQQEVPQETAEIQEIPEPVEEIPEEAQPETQETGLFYVHFNSGDGEITIGEDENAIVMRLEEENKLSLKNLDGDEIAESEVSEDGYCLVSEEVLGTEIHTSAKSDDGFVIAEYKVIKDSGEEETELPDYADEFEYNITIDSAEAILDVVFEEEEAYAASKAEAETVEAEGKAVEEESSEEAADDEYIDASEVEGAEEAAGELPEEETKEPVDPTRLIVKASNADIVDESQIIGKIDDTYLLQFGSKEEAEIAKEQYQAAADYVVDDNMILAADDGYVLPNEWTAEEIQMSAEENPFAETEATETAPVAKQNIIALIDTGVSDNPNVIQKLSVLGDDPIDHNGHGDAMLGKILEQNDQASVISIKALDDNGVGSISSLYAGIRLAIDSGAQIISLSLAANAPRNEALEEIIQEAISKGIIVVAAAGDKAIDVANCLPAGIGGVMAVGTCDVNGAKLPRSNYGDNVKYNVATTSSSYAAAIMAGHLSAHGLQVEPDNEVIFPADYEPEVDDSLDVTEQYIRSYMDTSLVGEGTPTPVNFMTVKQTLFDGMYVGPGETIDSIMSQPDDEEKLKKVISMFPAIVMVYEVSPDSPYYVAYANTMMNDASARVQDWEFAENNFDGIVVDAIYDRNTGLAYLPKSLYGGEQNFNPIQMQLMQIVGNWQSEMSTTVVALDAEGIDTPIASSQSRIMDFETTVQAVPAEMIGDVSEENIAVKMNGVPINEEYYSLDESTGQLTIGVPSAMAGTVSVEVNEPTVLEKIKESLLPVEVEAASANASIMTFANDGAHPLKIAATTTTGTSFRGNVNLQYGQSIGGNDYQVYLYEYGYDNPQIYNDIYFGNGITGKPTPWQAGAGGMNYAIDLDTIELTDENGNVVDFRDMGIRKFGMACMHIGSGPINTNEHIDPVTGGQSVAYVPVVGRFMEVDWDEQTAIIGVITGTMNGQTGFTLFKAHIQSDGAYIKLNKRSSDMIPLEYQLHLNRVGDETGFHTYGTGRRSSVRVESLQIKKPTKDQNGNPLPAGEIQFKVHQQSIGDVGPATGLEAGQYSDTWVTATTDGSARAGLTGNKKRIEGIMVRLTGELANQYDVVYTVHTSIDNEQLKTAKNGELAGSRGESLGLVDVDSIALVKKNTAINMDGAQYGIYRSQAAADAAKPGAPGSPIATITVNQYGASNWVQVNETGDYWLKEIAVPSGYGADTESHKVTINKMGDTAGAVSVDKRSVPPTLYKESSNPSITNGNTSYSLAGAVYGIYKTKAEADAATNAAPGTPIEKITTDATGKAVAKSTEYQFGSTYYAKELVASQGYKLDPSTISVTINSYTEAAVFRSKEVPRTGKVSLKKISGNTGVSNGNPCYSLAGAEYGIYSSESDANSNKNMLEKLTTDANGNASGQRTDYALGRTYWAKELKASPGYALDKQARNVTIVSDTDPAVFTSTEIPVGDPGNLTIQKVNKETGKADQSYAGSFKDALFTVNYYASTSATGNPTRTWVYKTNDDGISEFRRAQLLVSGESYKDVDGSITLPLGTITVQEKEAPAGFEKSDAIFTAHITQDTNGGPAVFKWDNGTPKVGNALKVEDTPIRTDIVLKKTKEHNGEVEDGARLPFLISRMNGENVAEAHIVVTNDKGVIDTKALLAAANKDASKVNKLDAGNKNGIYNGNLDDTNAIWYGEISALNTEGALVSGTYKIRELQCDANKGYDLLEAAFTVDNNGNIVNTSGMVKDGEQYRLENKLIDMKTTAVDKNTNLKIVPEKGVVVIQDTVRYTNLTVGREYIMKGKLVNADNPEEVIATGQTPFTPTSPNGVVIVDFEFDVSELNGRQFVVFESLYWGEINEQNHEDKDDKDQTIYIPAIGTTAVDAQTGDHVGMKGQEVKILDEVTFDNLQYGNKYQLKGVLMDKATGEPMLDAEGAEIATILDFEYSAEEGDTLKPELAEGQEPSTNMVFGGKRTLEFTLDTSEFDEQTTVVFETLYVTDGPDYKGNPTTEYATHKDINDEGQSVHFIHLHTNAIDKATGSHVGVAPQPAKQANGEQQVSIVEDTITMTNLSYGQEYTVHGRLVDQKASAEGDEVVYVTNEAGEPVEAELTFTADESYLSDMEVMTSKEPMPEGPELPNFDDEKTTHNETVESEETGNKTETTTETYSVVEQGEDGYYKVTYTQTSYKVISGDGEILEDVVNDPEEIERVKLDIPDLNYEEYGVYTVSGKVKLSFEVDNHKLQGKSIIVFEDLYHNDQFVADHKDITDKEQAVYYPTGKTTLTDNRDDMHQALATKTVQVTDTVYFEGLLDGEEYTIDGHLVYQNDFTDANGVAHKAGEPLADEGAKASVTFTVGPNLLEKDTQEGTRDASGETGTDESGTTEQGTEGETQPDGDQGTEGDATGEQQPQDGTNQEDGQSEDGQTTDGQADTGSEAGEEAQHTEEAAAPELINVKAEELPDGQHLYSGYVKLQFTIDASALEGQTIVAFEDFSKDGVRVFTHSDLNDLPQTVRIPKIRTTAKIGELDEASIYDNAGNFKDITLVDTVHYQNLWTPEDLATLQKEGVHILDRENDELIFHIKEDVMYIIKGVLMDKATGESLKDAAGKEYIAYSEPFKPTATEGDIDVTFKINAKDFLKNGAEESDLEGKTLVVFETLYRADEVEKINEDLPIAEHKDINDNEQDVRVPRGRTHATDGLAEEAKSGLSKAEIEALENGHEISKTTTPHEIMPAEEMTVVDRLTYTNLHGGTTYKATGVLMQKIVDADGNIKAVAAKDDEGNPIIQTAEFTTAGDVNDNVNGYVDLEFKFSGLKLENSTLVAFEEISRNGQQVIVHADINDEEQTIQVPKIRTSASDVLTGTHEGVFGTETYIVDKVAYDNLEKGKEYVITGRMMDAADGTEIGGTTVSGTFVAGVENIFVTKNGSYITDLQSVKESIINKTAITGEAPKAESGIMMNRVSGVVYVVMPIDSSKLNGHTVVAFEKLSAKDNNDEEKTIATHEDLKDTEQSVTYPDLHTEATVGGQHTAAINAQTQLIDTVTYTALEPNKEYTLRGVLMNKQTGQPIMIGDKTVTSELPFKPSEKNGSVQMPFNFDSTTLNGVTVVVFEDLYTKDSEGKEVRVATHSDINDEAQSVVMTTPQTGVPGVQTSDNPVNPWILVAIGAAIIAICVGLVVSKKRKKENK